ncbi:TPA: ImmA/IrrE family metallo-endopeptidase [Pseudomonas aeruginosa]|nr:ImmA/IrrE family metallo-endopeptidase [Pseudomonas aeruginosa]HBO1880921.1 ImmA/IrrE family metallo-endopeptidase [Pseudomonas aeruginosa]HBO2083911.1 ImmA/IrrE family metallo-endopeptidase [Pseudomonas aeruginosa]
MSSLSEIIGISKQAVSIFEKGVKQPTYENILKLSSALGVQVEFFFTPSRAVQEITTPSHFRSFKTATKKSRTKASVREGWLSELSQTLLKNISFPGSNVLSAKIEDFTELTHQEIEELAENARKHWGLGLGPISNVTLLLEKNGIFIGQFPMDRQVQAFSNWRGRLAYIVTEKINSNARHRFNLAHELGHLIMHTSISEEDHEDDELVQLKEDQANYFAGAFLFPKKPFLDEFTSCSLESLIHLKRRWGISIAALTVRARALGLLSENQSIYIFKQLAALPGGRKSEPLDKETPRENPKLIGDMIDFLERSGKLTKYELLKILPLSTEELSDITSKPKEYLHLSEVTSNVISFKLRQ